MGINHANAALTVIRYAPGRPRPSFSSMTPATFPPTFAGPASRMTFTSENSDPKPAGSSPLRDANRKLNEENERLRNELAVALGQLRDLRRGIRAG